jgi:PTH1 family peptidyl-tRNA hydrolase
MLLFVGLGNPGARHVWNRHNVGFMAVEAIAKRHGFPPWRRRFQGVAAEGSLGGERVQLLLPGTFMNESGRAVAEAMHFYKLQLSDVIVFHDELDLPPAKVRVKTGGGVAGHNGLRSITAHIGNEYARVRIGIGHPGAKDLVYRYVLHDFAKADAAWVGPLLDAVADAAPRLAAGDDARFLTDVARTLKGGEAPPKATAPRPERETPEPPVPRVHPAGERQSKRMSALDENLKKWLKGRRES